MKPTQNLPGDPVPGAQTQALETTSTLTIASGQTTSDSVDIGNPTDVGLVIGALNPSTTITVQVSMDGTNWRGLVDKAGAAELVLASGAGAVAVDTNAMGAILAYSRVRIVAGAAQTNGATATLCRKISRTDPTV